MKNHFFESVLIAAVAFLLPMQSFAYDFMVDGLCYNRNSDGTSVTVTYQRTTNPRYTNLTGALNIPASVTFEGDSYSVSAIGDNAFYGCQELTSVIIPNSVTTIGMNAFNNCIGMISLTIPNSVTAIGQQAFDNCIHLTSLTVPNSLIMIGNNAFRGCSGLNSMVVENGNPKYDSRDNCNAIIETAANKLIVGCKNTIIPNSVTSIGDFAFYDCSALTSITIPNSVTSMGNVVFFNCSGLTSVISQIVDPTQVTLGGGVFATVNMNSCILYVPAGTVATYKAAPQWKDFKNIIEMGPHNNMDAAITAGNVIVGNLNEETLLPLYLKSDMAITALSFTVELHNDIDLVDDINSFVVAGERGENFTFSATQNSNGTITISGTSTTPLEAGEGAVLNLRVKSHWQRTFTIPVTNMTVTTADGTVKQLPDSVTRLVIHGARGDMNGDGRVDLSDALYIINLATGLAE